MNKHDFYTIITSILSAKNLTFADLAKYLEISELNLARNITKNKTINIDLLLKIFDFLDISFVDNKTGNIITLKTNEDILSDALNNINS